jgi:ribulose kinase
MKKDKPCFLVIDFGTESVRGALFDDEGTMLFTVAREYKTYFPHSGWAEQKPEEWWESFLWVVRTITKESDVRPESIVSMAVDTTSCTVLALDEYFKPLRNAIIWMDVRSFQQANKIAASGLGALKYNGFGGVSAEWMPCKALWLKENEPHIYKKAKHICEFEDWVNYQLTGEYVGSINNTTIRWYYDGRNDGWPLDFYEQNGLADVIEKFPQRILELGKPIGPVKPELAAITGLSKDTLVVQSGADAFIGMIGLGAVKPGKLAFITGSSHLILGHTEKGSGSVLKWFKDKFISRKYEEKAKKSSLSIYDYLNSLAKNIELGSEGLILLNYWQGNRNPLVDSQIRGMIWGLSLKHSPVHIYRAILEGVSYGSEHIMRYLKEAGFIPREVYACGGATKSELWMQMQRELLGIPVYLTEEPNAPLLGDAILASYGAGVYRSIEEAVSKMVKIRSKIEPDLENTEKYKYYVDKYIETYPAMKDLMHDMLKHQTM